jgi:protein phosphatase
VHHREVPRLILPDPSLVVLVGAAGAGKSTLAARHFRAHEILSSDALRAAVTGDEADQSASMTAFAILHRALARRLEDGRMTVIDATNLRAAHRRPLLSRASAAGVGTAAIVLDLPGSIVRARNASRARVVDDRVVDRHLAAVREVVDRDALPGEGFDQVVVLRSADEIKRLEIERLEIVRTDVSRPG